MKTLLSKLSLGVVMLLCSSVGMAAVLTVNSNNNLPFVGQQFDVTLNATNTSNVGGITLAVAWDITKASFVSSSLPALGNGPLALGTGTFLVTNGTGGSRTLDVLPGAPPVSGDYPVAVLTFQGLAMGPMGLVVNDDGGISYGWFDNSTADYIQTNYIQANIFIRETPIPAAIWLFGSALGLMGWMRRKLTH